MRWLAAVALLLAFVEPRAASAQARGLQVTPVIVEMSEARPISSFTLRNGRGAEVAFEIGAYAWSQRDGRTVLTPTDAVIVAPSVFAIAPDGEQVVRLAAAPDPHADGVERAFRLIVRELPAPDAAPRGFRMLLELSLPLFVTPEGARGALAVRRTRDADGAPALLFANTGRAHLRLADVGGDAPGLPRYLLAGASVRTPAAPALRELTLVAADGAEAAPQPRAFVIADAPRLDGVR